MEKLKVNEYVRTKTGIINKIIKYDEILERYLCENNYMVIDKYNEVGIPINDIVGHSENIEELLKIDDILLLLLPHINKKMLYIINEYTKGEFIFEDIKEKRIKILKILTKEQFEKNSYELEKIKKEV